MSAASPAPLQIVELRASNVKRIKAVTIRPDDHGNLVVLSGANGAGKSSVLDAIAMALGGRDQIPAEPIRRGQDHAEVVVDMGELVVRRTFTASGGGTLTVSNRQGARFQSPQTMLDALVGRLSFDPLAFAREDQKRQAETLRRLLGLDFTAADAERDRLYAERTAVNKQVDQAKARLDTMPHHPDAPADPIDVGDLAQQLQAANKAMAANRERDREEAEARRALHEATDRVAKLRQDLASAERALVEAESRSRALSEARVQRAAVDTAPLLAQIRDAEATNRKVRDNHLRQEIAAQLGAAQVESTKLTQAIREVDAGKARVIAEARMPVPGLGFSPTGTVTLNDIPLDQASAAERLRVSVAIGIAMNPRLRVLLVRDASLLDQASMRMVAEMARASGCQLWVEQVDSRDPTAIVIEDGEVVGATAEAER